MKKLSLILTVIFTLTLLVAFTVPAFAAETAESAAEAVQADNGIGSKAIAAAIVVAAAAAAGAIAMGIAIAYSASAMARQPEAAGKINSAMMLGLVFIETAIIYALIVAILIIFVL